jgi:hypothetical protein
MIFRMFMQENGRLIAHRAMCFEKKREKTDFRLKMENICRKLTEVPEQCPKITLSKRVFFWE